MLLGALLLAAVAPAPAQQGAVSPTRAALAAALADGVRALEAQAYAAAIEALEDVFAEDPAFVAAGYGSAAYWLGRAYEAVADSERVRAVWREGLDALDTAGLFDPRLAGAFVRLTFAGGHGSDYPRGTLAYLQLIESLDWYPYTEEAAGFARVHLRALATLLPEEVMRQTGLDRLEHEGLPALAPDAGRRLVAWWRSQDVAPATRNNERLEEHLRRTIYAEARYLHEDGFDDRGRIYIRLGAPSRATDIRFDSMNFRDKVVDRSLTINQSDFPEGEFWYYEHIDEAAQFLFVKRGQGFRLGAVSDLLPATLRNGLVNTKRGLHKARATVRTLDEIYRRLALYHPAFATRYQDVAAFADLLDEAEIAARAAALFPQQNAVAQTEGGGDVEQSIQEAIASRDYTTANLPGSSFPVDRPDLFAQSFLMRGHAEDEQLRLQRENDVPHAYSNTFDEVDPLPTVLRLARFLDPDGTTRTEIYWGVPIGALQPSKRMLGALRKEGYEAEDYLLMTTVVQQAADYRARVVRHRRYVLPGLADATDAALAPRLDVALGDTGVYSIAMQWDQYTATLDAQGRPISLGMAVKANTFRADTLRALTGDARVLEMSDLKPMALPDQAKAARAADPLDAAVLYPFVEVDPRTPLLLYFEVYHLAFDTDDRTRFTVEYEMTHRTDGGPLRKDKTQRTSAQTEYTGADSTAKEYIELDLKAWEGEGRLDIVVRVTDRVTGRQVERVLPFTLVER